MLILGSVTRIGVHDQLSIRQALRQDERVDRRNHGIFIAVNYEYMSVGCIICFKVPKRPRAGMVPHSLIAASCATAEFLDTGRSRSSLRESSRFIYSRPAAWLASEGEKNAPSKNAIGST